MSTSQPRAVLRMPYGQKTSSVFELLLSEVIRRNIVLLLLPFLFLPAIRRALVGGGRHGHCEILLSSGVFEFAGAGARFVLFVCLRDDGEPYSYGSWPS